MATATATKIPFRTAYSEQIRVATNPGTPMQDIYGYEINEKGQKYLTKTGEKDLYAEIQSYKEECDIEYILSRAAVGDMSGFREDGFYGDVTELPDNLIQAKQEMQKLENFWWTLPLEVRNKYNNSVEEFIAKAGSESWMIDTGFLKPENAEDVSLKAPETTVPVPEPVAAE